MPSILQPVLRFDDDNEQRDIVPGFLGLRIHFRVFVFPAVADVFLQYGHGEDKEDKAIDRRGYRFSRSHSSIMHSVK